MAAEIFFIDLTILHENMPDASSNI